MCTYLSTRRSMPGSSDTLEANMMAAFCKKVNSLRSLDMHSAVPLIQAVHASDLCDDSKATVQEAIDVRTAAAIAGSVASAAAPSHSTQKLGSQLTSYLTSADWAALHDRMLSTQGKVQVLLDRFKLLGLRYPAEDTTKWAVALLVVMLHEATGQFPNYHTIYSMVEDFKSNMVASRARSDWAFSHVVMYPQTPQELPDDIFNHAYTVDDPPVTETVSRLEVTAMQHVPLRKTSSLLKTGVQSGVAAAAGGPTHGTGHVTWEQLQQLMGGMGSAFVHQRIHREKSLQDDSPSPQMSGRSPQGLAPRQAQLALTSGVREPVSQPRANQLALPPPPARGSEPDAAADADPLVVQTTSAAAATIVGRAAAAAAVEVASAGVPGRRSSDEIEMAAYDALNKRNASKASSRATVAKAAPAKSPAMKRPAAAPVDAGDDIVIAFMPEDAKKPKRNFQSKWFHRTEKHCKEQGLDDDDVTLQSREAYKLAGKLYDEHMHT